MNHLCTPREHVLSRREVLGGSLGLAAGALGLHSAQQANAAEATKKQHKQVLFIWLDGGMSQLESWDPKPNTRFGGPFRAIPTTVPGIHISELMPRCAKQMKHLALIRSVCTQDNSHSAGVARIQRGDPKNRGVVYPYFGSAVAKLMGSGDSGMPPYLWIKPGSGGFKHQDAGFLGPKYGALALGDGQPPENLLRHESLTREDDLARNELRKLADQRYSAKRRKTNTEATSYVYEMAEQMQKNRDLFDTSTFSKRDLERYGDYDLGKHMLMGRRMLEAGVRFVKVNSYGWDTHGDHFNGSASLVGKFDQSFAAIVEDLAERSMLDNVLVIAMAEFGRTPRINGHVGRDHWPEAWSVAMAGCGIQHGLAVGETNAEGTWVKSEEHDIGHLFHTWFRALGINPLATEYDNDGQPLPIAHDDCHPIREVLA